MEKQQLDQTLASLQQINDAFRQLSESLDSATKVLLFHAKAGLLNSLAEIREILSEDFRSSFPKFYKGALVLAPRFFQGGLCYDLAIISGENELASVGEDKIYDVDWLRPLSENENLSCQFFKEQLRPDGHNRYGLQKRLLAENLRAGDKVLVKLEDRVIWEPASVARFHNRDSTVEVTIARCTSLFHTATSVSSSSTDVQAVIPLKVTHIAPQPNDILITHASTTLKSTVEKNSDAGSQAEMNQVESFPRRQLGCSGTSSMVSSVAGKPIVLEDLMGLGEWEAHTRGIGGKLMAKMGYVRGRGLGKSEEGRVKPLPSCDRPLPAGMSLDFLSEFRKQNKLKESRSDGNLDMFGEATNKWQQLDEDIEKRRRQQAKDKAAGVKEETRRRKEEEPTVFAFLNAMRCDSNRINDSDRATNHGDDIGFGNSKIGLRKERKSRESLTGSFAGEPERKLQGTAAVTHVSKHVKKLF